MRRDPYGQFVDRTLDEVRPGMPLSMTGIVTEQDFTLGRVRVVFPDLDDLSSFWLRVRHSRARDDQHVDMPDIGEHVECSMDANHEDGCVVGALYSERDPMPAGMTADLDYRRYKDGTVIVYDRAAHVLRAAFPDGATLEYDAAGSKALVDTPGEVEATAGSKITLNAPDVEINATTVTVNATAMNINALTTIT